MSIVAGFFIFLFFSQQVVNILETNKSQHLQEYLTVAHAFHFLYQFQHFVALEKQVGEIHSPLNPSEVEQRATNFMVIFKHRSSTRKPYKQGMCWGQKAWTPLSAARFPLRSSMPRCHRSPAVRTGHIGSAPVLQSLLSPGSHCPYQHHHKELTQSRH